jgi:hypothetical protein
MIIISEPAETPDRDIHLISAVDRPEYSHCCVFMLALCLMCGIVADFTLDQTTNCHSLRYSHYLVIQEPLLWQYVTATDLSDNDIIFT